MNQKWNLCPTCSQQCQYKDGILCRAWICAKKSSSSNSSNGMDELLDAMGIKPGNPTYDIFKKGSPNEKSS
jgi:hypothetical protein